MNNQTITPCSGSLGFFFPQPEPLKKATKEGLSGITFRGQRTDLQVYHLAYGTKKLRACTYRRMKKRQDRINQKKAKMLIVKSPEEKLVKANKQAWLRSVDEVVEAQKLKATTTIVPKLRRGKGAGKKKRKHTKAIKAKIAKSQTANDLISINQAANKATANTSASTALHNIATFGANKIKFEMSNEDFPSLLNTEMKD